MERRDQVILAGGLLGGGRRDGGRSCGGVCGGGAGRSLVLLRRDAVSASMLCEGSGALCAGIGPSYRPLGSGYRLQGRGLPVAGLGLLGRKLRLRPVGAVPGRGHHRPEPGARRHRRFGEVLAGEVALHQEPAIRPARVYVPGDPKGEHTEIARAVEAGRSSSATACPPGWPRTRSMRDTGPAGSATPEWETTVASRRRGSDSGSVTETVLARSMSPLEHTAIDTALTARIRR